MADLGATKKTTAKKRAPRRHYVDARGNKLPGVTTIMQHLGWSRSALIGWAHKLGREGRSLGERDEAAALGSCTHALVAAAFPGGEEFDPSEWRAEHIAECRANAYRVIDLIRSRYAVVVAVEKSITSLYFGGTIDFVVRDGDGSYRIVDLKTGKGVYRRENCVQLGAYARLWRESEDGRERDTIKGDIIHAHGSSPLMVHEISRGELDTGEAIFASLLDIDRHVAMIEED